MCTTFVDVTNLRRVHRMTLSLVFIRTMAHRNALLREPGMRSNDGTAGRMLE